MRVTRHVERLGAAGRRWTAWPQEAAQVLAQVMVPLDAVGRSRAEAGAEAVEHKKRTLGGSDGYHRPTKKQI